MNENLIVSLKDIVVDFDGQKVLDGLSLDIHDKEFVTFLGPSGCGKTTTLRVIAGFVTPKSGNVFFDGKDIANMPPYKRPVNTVFQKYALFPHLNVFENVAFGLRLKKMTEEEIRPKVLEMLEIVGLKGFERRSIHQLSGGKIQQIGSPQDIYNEPKNAFVARFIGDSNIVDGVMLKDFLVNFGGYDFTCVDRGFKPNEPVQVVIRPEDVQIVPPSVGMLTGLVREVIFKGVHFEMHVDVEGYEWIIHSTQASQPGELIGMNIGPDEIHIMKRSEV